MYTQIHRIGENKIRKDDVMGKKRAPEVRIKDYCEKIRRDVAVIRRQKENAIITSNFALDVKINKGEDLRQDVDSALLAINNLEDFVTSSVE